MSADALDPVRVREGLADLELAQRVQQGVVEVLANLLEDAERIWTTIDRQLDALRANSAVREVLARDAEAQAARQERDPGQGWTWVESIAGGRVLDGLRGGDVCEVIRDDRTGRTYIAPLGTPPPMAPGYTVARITVGGGTS